MKKVLKEIIQMVKMIKELQEVIMKILKIVIVITFLIFSFVEAKDLLIVDTSGSMSPTYIQKEIKTIVKKYLKDTSNDVIAFSDSITNITNEKDLKFSGSTALSKALQKAHEYDYLILLTDGLPNNQTKTSKEANKLRAKGIKICSIYITKKQNSTPKILETISDKIFSTSEIQKAFESCNSSVRKSLIGTTAFKTKIDPNKYDF